MAQPQKRDKIEAIGSQHAASANAANHVQVPVTPRPVQAPTTSPTAETAPVSPVSYRRNDSIQFSPLASQKVYEANASVMPRRNHGQDVSTAARMSPHGHDLARLARGDISLDQYVQEVQERQQKAS